MNKKNEFVKNASRQCRAFRLFMGAIMPAAALLVFAGCIKEVDDSYINQGGGVPDDTELTFTFVKSAVDNAPVDGTVTPVYLTDDPETNQLQYSTDGGETWEDIASGATTPSAHKILFRGSGRTGLLADPKEQEFSPWAIHTEGKTRASGNINTVLDYENPPTSVGDFAFCMMFFDCDSLIDAPKFPATTVGANSYYATFFECNSLVKAPDLPATTLDEHCYDVMFGACTSLETAPELPATTLADGCYDGMFLGCTSLETAPELPATTLADSCYDGMFLDCTSLKTAPELPATTLADGCYDEMFMGCTSLETAPELPATTLTDGCYRNLFNGCSSLSEIHCSATNISAEECLEGWTEDVAASGTFYKNASMNSWPRNSGEDYDGIPAGWTVANLQ